MKQLNNKNNNKNNNRKISNEEHNTDFNTQLKCLKQLLNARMSKGRKCFIKGCNADIDKFYIPLNKSRAFLCKNCLTHIHPTVDSIFDRTHILLPHWFEITYRMLSSRNSVSANEIFRDYGYGLNTIFYLMHNIRTWMEESLQVDFSNQMVEVDESYISTGKKGHSRNYPFKPGRGSEDDTNFLVMKARGGGVKLITIPDCEASSIIPHILKNIPTNSIVITDKWGAYTELSQSYNYTHYVVNHSNHDKSKKYVDGMASTNNAENIFSLMKRAIKGTHVHIEDKYLPKYLAEIAFRLTYKDARDYGFSVLMENLSSLSEHYGKKSAA